MGAAQSRRVCGYGATLEARAAEWFRFLTIDTVGDPSRRWDLVTADGIREDVLNELMRRCADTKLHFTEIHAYSHTLDKGAGTTSYPQGRDPNHEWHVVDFRSPKVMAAASDGAIVATMADIEATMNRDLADAMIGDTIPHDARAYLEDLARRAEKGPLGLHTEDGLGWANDWIALLSAIWVLRKAHDARVDAHVVMGDSAVVAAARRIVVATYTLRKRVGPLARTGVVLLAAPKAPAAAVVAASKAEGVARVGAAAAADGAASLAAHRRRLDRLSSLATRNKEPEIVAAVRVVQIKVRQNAAVIAAAVAAATAAAAAAAYVHHRRASGATMADLATEAAEAVGLAPRRRRRRSGTRRSGTRRSGKRRGGKRRSGTRSEE